MIQWVTITVCTLNLKKWNSNQLFSNKICIRAVGHGWRGHNNSHANIINAYNNRPWFDFSWISSSNFSLLFCTWQEFLFNQRTFLACRTISHQVSTGFGNSKQPRRRTFLLVSEKIVFSKFLDTYNDHTVYLLGTPNSWPCVVPAMLVFWCNLLTLFNAVKHKLQYMLCSYWVHTDCASFLQYLVWKCD